MKQSYSGQKDNKEIADGSKVDTLQQAQTLLYHFQCLQSMVASPEFQQAWVDTITCLLFAAHVVTLLGQSTLPAAFFDRYLMFLASPKGGGVFTAT